MPCGWEGNRRSGVALVMRHRLQWFIHLRAHGLRKGDEQFEHPAYAWSLKRYGTLYLYPGCELTAGGQGVDYVISVTPGGWRYPPPFAAICGTVTLNNVAENAAWTRQDRSATMSALLYSTPPDSLVVGRGLTAPYQPPL